MNIEQIITLFSILVVGIVLGVLLMTIVDLRKRIRALEDADRRRLPFRTADEIEDATAAINALMFDLDLKRNMVENALEHLKAARNPKK